MAKFESEGYDIVSRLAWGLEKPTPSTNVTSSPKTIVAFPSY